MGLVMSIKDCVPGLFIDLPEEGILYKNPSLYKIITKQEYLEKGGKDRRQDTDREPIFLENHEGIRCIRLDDSNLFCSERLIVRNKEESMRYLDEVIASCTSKLDYAQEQKEFFGE